MTTGMTAEVLADPVGVAVRLIAGLEPQLDRVVIQEAVTSIAGGRAKRRKLAQALTLRPMVLTDGRSPGPRPVGDLLIALRKAGATVISPPICARCAKPLRTLQRRDQDWYCSVCIRRPGRCSACGQEKVISTADRKGQPRCKQCPDRDERDPLAVLAAAVATADPSLPAHVVSTAARRVFSKPAHLQRLAWVIEEEPALLSGGGARAPIGGVLRLIDELCDAGAQAITRPACPRCQRVVRLYRRIGGLWCCRNCVARSRAQPCARCGTVREIAIRDEQGRPLCPHCLITDPANQEECAGCGRRRPVSVRGPGGPLCQNCRPLKTLTCGVCGKHVPCVVSKATGKPWCLACRKRWDRCSRCGTVAPIRGGTADAPLCSVCTRPDAGFWRKCPGCGRTGRMTAGRWCVTCHLRQRLRDLLGGPDGTIRPGLQPLYDNLAGYERPATVLGWLGKPTTTAVLGELGTGQRSLTHAAFDELPDSKPLRHLRAVLVATGVLPPRDEQLTRLEHWASRAIAERSDRGQRQLLHRYATWHVIRRLRSRLGGAHATHGQANAARQHIKAAIAVLNWLTTHDLTLATVGQADLEEWLASTQSRYRTDAGNFVRWARRHKLTRLDFAAIRWAGPSGVIDTETRWEQARWLLHDEHLKPEDRVAGLLVLLYAQYPATLSRLTLDHVHAAGGQVRIRLGREPVVLPAPLDTLVLTLTATRRGHAAVGDQGSSPWLFPGGHPGQPISAFQLSERLRQLGIRSGQSRSAALFQLATELPAAVLARLLGIHITVAVAWQRAAAGDWAAYAAQVSRRSPGKQGE
jgi:hypothetical protein